MSLEDGDAQVRPGLAAGDLFLRPQGRRPAAEEAEVMLRRELAAGDADVAGDPRLGVHHPVARGGRVVVEVVPAAELTWVAQRVGRVEGVVEVAEIHRPQQRLGPLMEPRAVVADHDERRGEPAVVHRGEERADRPAVVRPGHQGLAGPGVEVVREEPMDPAHPGEGRQRPVEPPVGLGRLDQPEAGGGDRAPEVGGDVRRRRPDHRARGVVPAAAQAEAVGRQPGGQLHRLERPPAVAGIPQQDSPLRHARHPGGPRRIRRPGRGLGEEGDDQRGEPGGGPATNHGGQSPAPGTRPRPEGSTSCKSSTSTGVIDRRPGLA